MGAQDGQIFRSYEASEVTKNLWLVNVLCLLAFLICCTFRLEVTGVPEQIELVPAIPLPVHDSGSDSSDASGYDSGEQE